MFQFFNKKQATPVSHKVRLKISGMHCASCAMNISGELEDLPGVVEANTNYAAGFTEVEFLTTAVSIAEIKKVIEQLGYEVEE